MKKFIKLIICSFLIFFALSTFAMPTAYAFDCQGKANGNYEDPTDCTKFITCSNGYTYEMDCPACSLSDGVERCPKGKLHYSVSVDRCEWANVANCQLPKSTSNLLDDWVKQLDSKG